MNLSDVFNFLRIKVIEAFFFNLAALSTIDFGDKTMCIGQLLTLEIRQTQGQ